MAMTWKEFKEMVDKELDDREEDQSVEIFYIDTGNYPNRLQMTVTVGDDGLEIF